MSALCASAIWVWRGQSLAFELAEDWQVDYASYAWQKLDPQVSFFGYRTVHVPVENIHGAKK